MLKVLDQPVMLQTASTIDVSELAHRCGGTVAHNVVASITDVRLRDGFNLRLITGTGFVYATLTDPNDRTVSSLKVQPLTKKELDRFWKWVEKTVPKPKKVRQK
jgi:hypothetical protein